MHYFQLLQKLCDIYSDNHGRTLSKRQIVGKINRAVNLYDVRIKGIKSIAVLGNSFDISGIYDHELDFEDKPSIGIEIVFPEYKEKFTFDESDFTEDHWITLSVDVASVIGHEYVHQRQARRRHFNEGRNYKSNSKNIIFKEQQEYYGTPDEVDAYAYTLAVSLINQKALESKKRISITKTQTYKIYCHFFGRNNEITNRLIKKSKTYYRHLEREYHDFYNKN